MTTAQALKITVVRFGDFGDALSLTAVAESRPAIGWPTGVGVKYRGRVVAWIDHPAAVAEADVQAAVLSQASWLLGGRCPEMDAYRLSFL